MAGVAFYNLPPALALNGGEQMVAYQQGPTQATPWIGVQLTTSQLAAMVAATLNLPTEGYISMQQLMSALAAKGVLYAAFEALPSDITNSYNIAWNHAYTISPSDPFIVKFLQPAINYTAAQMQNLFVFAQQFVLDGPLAPPPAYYVSMRQLIAALGAQSVLVTAFDGLPSDVTSAYNIAWNHAYIMSVNDTFVTAWLKPTLGYTDLQIAALFNLAATFPV